MGFKDFMNSTFRLPATLLKGVTTLIFGSQGYNEDGTRSKKNSFPGLVGLVLGTGQYILGVGRSISESVTALVRANQKAIAAAFWFSLLAAGAAALTVAFWPAALAAVVNFSIAGFSIASVFGANFAVQVGVTAAAAALLASAATYTGTTTANFVNYIRSCFAKSTSSANQAEFVGEKTTVKTSASALSKLHTTNGTSIVTELSNADAPVHTATLLKTKVKEVEVEKDVLLAPTSSMSA